MTRVLAFAIHNTVPWWRFMMSELGFAEGQVFSDIRGLGDFNTLDDFYATMRGDAASIALEKFGPEQCGDIIQRCRVLRNLPRARALAMIGGMYAAIAKIYDRVQPSLVMSLTIDRYTTDVASRLARQRGVEFVEMTASIVPSEVMFLKRGVLQTLRDPSASAIDHSVSQIYAPDFVPSYVSGDLRFSQFEFYKTVAYFEARGLAFNALRYLHRDRWNLHYLDAQRSLSHKVRRRDVAVLDLLQRDWATRVEGVERSRRVFLGLQLYPEASMDYWLKSQDMLDHDRVILAYCDALGDAGFHVFVKDHPLQFGFRKIELIRQLHRRSHVTLVPYEVPAQAMLALCDVSVTMTGTIGFQAALAGLCSVVTEPYYSTDEHFVQVRKFDEIATVPDRIRTFSNRVTGDRSRRDLMQKLASGSVPGDYFTFRRFNALNPEHRLAIGPLIESLRTYLPVLLNS